LNAPAGDWAALDRALSDFAASGCVEVREDGQWLAELAALQCEINRKGKQALVPLGSDERNLTRRVLRVQECAEDRIVLEVQRFGRTNATKPCLARLLHQLGLHRNSLAEDVNHYLCRSAPERWLETIVSEDPTKLDAQLDARHFYSQVPALAAGDRGVLDLLGITRRGRLVVIELKASEDIQMPIPAVDYWLRVRRHQREEDFQEYGYFSGIEIDRWCGLWPPGDASIPRPTLF